VPCSVDSATERAIAAAARLRDYGQEDDEPTSSKALPSALAAFGQVGRSFRAMCRCSTAA
jgi:hypothetical protein